MNRKHFLILSVCMPILALLIGKIFFAEYISAIFNVQYSIWGIVLLVVVSPILEETVFRGLLQEFLIKKINNKLVSFTILNIIFAIIHYQSNSNIVYLGSLFICGIIFSIIKNNYKKLSYAIYLHSYYNILFVVFLKII